MRTIFQGTVFQGTIKCEKCSQELDIYGDAGKDIHISIEHQSKTYHQLVLQPIVQAKKEA